MTNSSRPAWIATALPTHIEHIVTQLGIAFDASLTPEGDAHWQRVKDRLLQMVGECKPVPMFKRPDTVRTFETHYRVGNRVWHAFDVDNFDVNSMSRLSRVIGWGHTSAEAIVDWDRKYATIIGEEFR